MVPFLTQNYHNVYVLDYREYFTMDLDDFVDYYQVDDVIFCHMLGMVQASGSIELLTWLCE